MASQLIDFSDAVRPVMDGIEHLSTILLAYCQMVSLFLVNKYLTAITTGQDVPAGAQFPWLLYEVYETVSLLSSFEQHEEALLS